ncbi:MAG: glycoside hydrolase family 3 protein [candidate division KSB1 bacterium]|nr:glycoside hydrolase family 3 protein [candidate division KSB1 bacterium]MDZ7273744.1 glycoside hydrolase family 3 protein [candidate division KSB1 bacterium]MDZ7285900.1 glycoside hydrolase family 3 protein [candidate division KSB1 bacterium]MDZ7298932.1 glycoside hydrolase family 3 protein [candidate division KSB1 bacterium]MDZ7307607.1 glycoside hydrolase family 3 protein [candidate division KSB1 bacterium]
MNSTGNAAQWVESTLAHMSLEEKVGQMLLADFAAVFTNHDHENWRRIVRLLRELHIGGIILAGGGLLEVALITNELQRLARVPLLVNADMETGALFPSPWRRARGRAPDLPAYLSGGGTEFPRMMAIGATRSTALAYEIGRLTGREARAAGIHWTNSPVLDLSNNPRNPIINVRAFGEEPQLVARLGVAYLSGCQAAGLIATMKHFPGQGDTDMDTHVTLPVLDFDAARLQAVELMPFKAAIQAGVKAAMTAHIALPRIDATCRPATLSPPIVTGLLRQQLRFEGLVVSDALTMQGISDYYSAGEAALLAAQAGVDMLLIPADIDAAHRRLVQAVQHGELPLTQVESAARRVLAAKAGLGLHLQRTVAIEELAEVVQTRAAQELAQQAASAAITLLEDDARILPLRTHPSLKLAVGVVSNSALATEGEYLNSRLAAAGHVVDTFRLSAEMSEARLAQALTACRQAEVVVFEAFLTMGAWKGELQLPPQAHQFLQAARDGQKPVIALSLGDPYMFAHLPPMAASLCAYGGSQLMEGAMARALLGEAAITGKLPVTIPGRFGFGHGLERHW